MNDIVENQKLLVENYRLKNQITSLNTCYRIQTRTMNDLDAKYKILLRKNAKSCLILKNLSKKIDFYLNLNVNSDFDKGFYKAFEIMKNCLNQKFGEGVSS